MARRATANSADVYRFSVTKGNDVDRAHVAPLIVASVKEPSKILR